VGAQAKQLGFVCVKLRELGPNFDPCLKRLKPLLNTFIILKRLKMHLKRIKTFNAFKTFKAFKAFKVL